MDTAVDRLKPERLGEINLLLEALGPSEMNVAALKRRIREMAGRIDHAPLPDEYVELCSEVAIVEMSDTGIRLTSLGERAKQKIDPANLSKLSEEQAFLLEPEIISHPSVEGKVQAAMKRMGTWIDGTRRFSVGQQLNSREEFGLKILQSLRLAKFQVINGNDLLTMEQETFVRISQSGIEFGKMTEEELWRDLDDQRERARIAEILVVEYEKQRLIASGENQLSECVDRVSERDAGAGYDVLSFSTEGEEIYIEVKSSTSTRVRFFWSVAERRVAEDKGNAYWIYFVPRAHEITNSIPGLLMINNPVPRVGYSLLESASNFEVRMSQFPEFTHIDQVGDTSAKVLR